MRLFEKMQTLMLIALTLTSTGQAFGAFLNVCERTVPVKDFIVQAIGKSCEAIAEPDLANLKRIAVPDRRIPSFKVGDFSGLPSLEILNIKGNPFTELPAGLMSELPSLKTLVIFRTKLVQLPNDFLEKNPKMENLHAFGNPFRTISESVFTRLEGMPNLQNLDFDSALQPAELARLKKDFPDGGRVNLDLH